MALDFDLDREIEVHGGVISEVMNDEVCLLNLKTKDYFRLNGSGSWIFQQLPRNGRELVSVFAERYGQSEARVVDEVSDFLAAMSAEGLLRE